MNDTGKLEAMLNLMDRQILDHGGRMIGKADDLELEERPDGRIVVSGILTGPGALGPRLGGALGSITTAAWSRLSGRPRSAPRRIDMSAVTEVGIVIRLGIGAETAQVDGFETWMRDQVISAFPDAGEKPT